MGDTSIASAGPGDLIVNIFVKNNTEFQREGTNLIVDRTISVWDAMLGLNMDLKTLDQKTLNINIPAGTQPDSVLRMAGEGLPDMRNRVRGNLLLRIKIDIPRNLDQHHKQLIQQLKNAL